jgi:GntR family transcriptional regulator
MQIEFDSDTPIYLQLIRMIRQAIVTGTLPPGSKMPSVRDLAIEYGVNPNTVQRSLTELERDGLVFAERTAGRFITSDDALIESIRAELADRQIADFTEHMLALGYRREQLLQILSQKWSEKDANH